MTTLLEREMIIADKLRDALPASISLAQRTLIVRLIVRLIRVELMMAQGVPDEAGNIGGEEDTAP